LCRRFERGEHGAGEARPGRGLEAQLGASFRGQRVVLGAPVVLRDPPISRDPAAGLEAVKGGVEGAFFYAKDVVGGLLDPARDGVAVRGTPADGPENEQVKRAAENFDARCRYVPIEFLCEVKNGRPSVETQGKNGLVRAG